MGRRVWRWARKMLAPGIVAHSRMPRRRRRCAAVKVDRDGWCRSPRTAGACLAREARQSATAGSGSISTSIASSASSAIAGAVGQHHRDRLADIAHLVSAITGCWNGSKPARAASRIGMRGIVAADIRRGDDGVHARQLQRRARHRCDDAAMRHASCAGSPHAAGRPARRSSTKLPRGRAGSADPRCVRSACRCRRCRAGTGQRPSRSGLYAARARAPPRRSEI